MTSDSLNTGSIDAASEVGLVDRRHPSSMKATSADFAAAVASATPAQIAAASTGPASAMAAMTYPLLVTSTVTPPGAAVNRVMATTAYSATRE